MDKTDKKYAEDILFQCYVKAEKGDGTTEVQLKAMHEYAAQERDKVRNQAIQNCIEKVRGLRDSVSDYEYGKTYFDVAYGSVIMELEVLKTKLT